MHFEILCNFIIAVAYITHTRTDHETVNDANGFHCVFYLRLVVIRLMNVIKSKQTLMPTGILRLSAITRFSHVFL